MTERHRSFVFTLNNYTDAHIERFKNVFDSSSIKYRCYGKEIAPTTLTPHLQGFITFHEAKTFSSVKHILGNDYHIEAKSKHSTFAQCIDYCKKDGDFTEHGTKPLDRVDIGKKTSDKWQHARDLAMDQTKDMGTVDPEIYVKHIGNLLKIRSINTKRKRTLEQCAGIWIKGKSGSGKTTYATEKWPTAYIKGRNKWWDGYTIEETCILDDIDPTHAAWIGGFLKDWTGQFSFQAESKGSSIQIRPDTFVITSQYSIDEVFLDRETREAITRRCKVMDFDNDIEKALYRQELILIKENAQINVDML